MAYFPIFTQIEGKRCLIIGGGKVAARKVHTLLRYGADVVVVAEKVCEEIKKSLSAGNIFEYIYKNESENELEQYSEINSKTNLGLNLDSDLISNSEVNLDSDLVSDSEVNLDSDLNLGSNPALNLKCDSEGKKDMQIPMIMNSDNSIRIHRIISLENEIKKAFLVIAATSSREENHRVAELCRQYNILVNVADSEKESTFVFPSIVRKGDISIGINSGTGSPAVSKQIRKQIEKAVPDYYADITVFMGELRQYVKTNFKEEAQRRYILKTAAAKAFSEERVLTKKEIEEIIRQGQK